MLGNRATAHTGNSTAHTEEREKKAREKRNNKMVRLAAMSTIHETFGYIQAFYKYRVVYTERRQAIAMFSLLLIYTHIFFFLYRIK